MSAPKKSKRESTNRSSFLGNEHEVKDRRLEYLFDEQESTVLDSVFAELFRQVEDKYLTNSENISDKL